MNYLVNSLFYIIATFFSIKTIFYGIYELKQKNLFGGSFVIIFSIASYILVLVMMSGILV